MRGLAVREGQLRLVDDLAPVPVQAGEVEVRVVCASVNPTDLELAEGLYDAMVARHSALHLARTGLEFSGVVTQGGARFQVGDAVYGYVDLLRGAKTHQERIAIREAHIAPKPADWTFAQAAAFPLGAQTAYVALKQVADARAGEHVLIHGASGGLGVYAVQIARKLGLHSTAVAGPDQEAFLRELGADEVLDYTAVDVRTSGRTFDIILEWSTRWTFAQAAPLLSSRGRFVPAEPVKAQIDFSTDSEASRRSRDLWVAAGDGPLLEELADWVAAGDLRVLVDSEYPFEDYPTAFSRIRESSKRGRVVLTLPTSGD